MPSVKVEKPPANNVVTANNKEAVAVPSGENVDSPVRQISLIIEHKIRNLEKRKVSKKVVRKLKATTHIHTLIRKVFLTNLQYKLKNHKKKVSANRFLPNNCTMFVVVVVANFLLAIITSCFVKLLYPCCIWIFFW